MPLLEFKGFIKTDELNIKFSLDQSMLRLLCSLIYYDTGKSSDAPEKLLNIFRPFSDKNVLSLPYISQFV